MHSPHILAVLRGTELESLLLFVVAPVMLALLASYALGRAANADEKRRALDTLTDTTDFCEDLSADDSYMADVGADSVPPLQSYKPPLKDVLS